MAILLELKRLPRCPYLRYGTQSECKHTGLSVGKAGCQTALELATIIHYTHPELRIKPVSYEILDTGTLLAALPLISSPCVLRAPIEDLDKALHTVVDKAIARNIPCFSLLIYYNMFYDYVFILTENVHEDDTPL